eukprot:6021846-Amphidinium_carterae.1
MWKSTSRLWQRNYTHGLYKRWQLPLHLETTSKRLTLTTRAIFRSAQTKIVWSTDRSSTVCYWLLTAWSTGGCTQRPIWCTDWASKRRQLPVWFTDWGQESCGMYIAGDASLYISLRSPLRTERASSLQTKEQDQSWRSQPWRTTKVTNYFTGFGKASMLQRDSTRTSFLGGGWLKLRWLNAPGQPAPKHSQQATVGKQQMGHRLVTAFDPMLNHEVMLHVVGLVTLQ